MAGAWGAGGGRWRAGCRLGEGEAGNGHRRPVLFETFFFVCVLLIRLKIIYETFLKIDIFNICRIEYACFCRCWMAVCVTVRACNNHK